MKLQLSGIGMNRLRLYIIFFSFFCIQLSSQLRADEPIYSDVDEVEDIFEDEDDAFAQAAANTSVMQQEIKVKPISPFMLMVRKAWDKVLIAYLWMQQKYVVLSVYVKSKFGPTENN